jgi:hypothetical protein
MEREKEAVKNASGAGDGAKQSARTVPQFVAGSRGQAKVAGAQGLAPQKNGLLIEVVGNTDGHFAPPEEERGLEEEGRLIVQQVLPPFGREKLGQNDVM